MSERGKHDPLLHHRPDPSSCLHSRRILVPSFSQLIARRCQDAARSVRESHPEYTTAPHIGSWRSVRCALQSNSIRSGLLNLAMLRSSCVVIFLFHTGASALNSQFPEIDKMWNPRNSVAPQPIAIYDCATSRGSRYICPYRAFGHISEIFPKLRWGRRFAVHRFQHYEFSKSKWPTRRCGYR